MANISSRTVAFAAVILSVIAGCSSSDNNPTEGNAAVPQVTSVQPANGATGVPPGANIRMVFNTSMDTASVNRGFHLAGGPDMQQWMDSLQSHRAMNGRMMNMDSMMRRLDSLQYPGSFQWSHGTDTVVFIPDTHLAAGQPHFIFLWGDIKGKNGRSMVMDTFSYGGYMAQFTTGS